MKLFGRPFCAHLGLDFCVVLVQVLLSVKAFSLSESYENFVNANGIPYNNRFGAPNNGNNNNRFIIPNTNRMRNNGISNNVNFNNGNSESEESSTSLESVESNEDSNARLITPSTLPPAPQSTYFVTATRYETPDSQQAMGNEVQETTELPKKITETPQNMQIDENVVNISGELEDVAPPQEDVTEETTTTPQQEIVTSESPSNESTEPTPTLTKQLEKEEEKVRVTPETPDVPPAEENAQAELVKEPIPTPLALISSNGEGSNPPLEEEFAEAFKKVGPTGRRRRVRPGGGRKRVRMRVRKLNKSAEEDKTGDDAENEVSTISTIRPRRYRSTTPAPVSIPPTVPELQSTEITPSTIQSGSNKPPVVSDVHTGSIGVKSVPKEEPLQQMEKPNFGGFTEKISTYFFTPPPRISTTIVPKTIQNESTTTSSSAEDSKAMESQVQSSRAFSMKSHLWDTTEDSLNDVINKSLPTKATSIEPEKSESVRKTVLSPMMENRSYSVQSDTDYDSGTTTRNNFLSSPPPFLESLDDDNQNSNNLRNEKFDFSRGATGNGPNNVGSMPPVYYSESPNEQFPPTTGDITLRSHYDRTKDPFFTNNQFFKNSNQFPSLEQAEFSQSVEQPERGKSVPILEQGQMQLAMFDQNGFVNSASPMAEQFYATSNQAEQKLNTPNNDYGRSTHYVPTDFLGSPVDPIFKGVGLTGEKRRKKKRPAFKNLNFDKPAMKSSPVSESPQSEPYQVPVNNNVASYSDVEPQNNGGQSEGLGYPQNLERPIEVPLHYQHHPIPHGNEIICENAKEYAESEGSERPADNNVSPIPNFTEPTYESEVSNPSQIQNPEFAAVQFPHHMSTNGPNQNDRFPSQMENPAFAFNRPIRPSMMHRPIFFRNNIPPPPPPPMHMHMHHYNHQHARFNMPQPNTPYYSIASPTGFDDHMNDGPPPPGRPPPNFHNTSPLVNLPMPGLSNIPPPPSEQQAFSEVQPTHHFPPHTHSMSEKPDYEPANPPLPQGHPMEVNFGNYGSELGNNIDEHHQFQSHHYQEHSVPPHFEHPPKPDAQSPSQSFMNNNQEHHNHHESSVRNNNHHDHPGYDILSAYYDKPPPTVGSDVEQSNGRHPEISHHENEQPKVPYQYSSSDGGGLDGNLPFLHSSNTNAKDTESKEKGKGNSHEDKNITAMYSETPYVLMFPQLVSEEAMIPPPPKILTKEIPVVQASSLQEATMEFGPDGKPVLGPGLKAVPVHPRHQMYQVLAKAHYDKALQNYMETRKKPPSAIYTPYGILVPMGPSMAASINHEKYAKAESPTRTQTQAHHEPEHHPKDPHERQLLHLLLGKKSPLGHFHLLKHASIRNGRLKQHFDIKANVDNALELLADKLAIKLSTAKYLLSAPAKLGINAFKKHATSYSELKPIVHPPPKPPRDAGRTFNSLMLGTELNEILSASLPTHKPKYSKGEEVDPELKAELKRLLKDRLREILEETEAAEREKDQLAAMASNAVSMKVPFPAIESKPDKWSSYFAPQNGGLIGTIKRLFFGSPSIYNDKPDADYGNPFGSIGGRSGVHLLNSVGRMGMPSPMSRNREVSEKLNNVFAQKRIKSQLEKWLDMVLTQTDMSASESGVKPVYVKYPGPSGRLGKSVGNSLSTFSMHKPGDSSGVSKFSSVPSSFLSSSWKPIVSSAFRSVFNYPSTKTSSLTAPKS